MTFFPNDEIQKFFPGFDGTLSIQYGTTNYRYRSLIHYALAKYQ